MLSRFSEAIEKSGVDVVPRVIVGGQSNGSGNGSSGGVLETLLSLLLTEKIGESALLSDTEKSKNPEVEALRQTTRDAVMNRLRADNGKSEVG